MPAIGVSKVRGTSWAQLEEDRARASFLQYPLSTRVSGLGPKVYSMVRLRLLTVVNPTVKRRKLSPEIPKHSLSHPTNQGGAQPVWIQGLLLLPLPIC